MKEEFKKYLIDETIPLVEALKVLNETGKRIVFLQDKGKLKGSLTYGDVSRWILNGCSLAAPASEAATKEPVFLHNDHISDAERVFDEKKVNALPVVDNEDTIVEILFKGEKVVQLEQIDCPVVIMAGGKGTRLYPFTKILPKPLIPIGEIPISEHIVNRFYNNGCREFFFIVNYKKNMIKAYFNEISKPYNVYFIDENKPLGTGGGLSLMHGRLSSTFILTNCDSFIDEDYSKIIKQHKEKKNLITMICSNQNYEVPYGVVESNEQMELVSLKEKPRLSYLTNTGTYIVEPEVIDMIEQNKVIGFPDVALNIRDAGNNVGIYIVEQSAWLDMGQFDTMDEMKKRLGVNE